MFLEANIPVGKADHPKIRAFLSHYVKNGGFITKTDQLRKAHTNENQLLNSQELDQEVITIVIKINNVEY